MRKALPINSRDVARLAGVSQSTVSKVANNNMCITVETRARVIRAARELGYVLNPRKSSYRRIAVIIPGQQYVGYIASMLSGVSQELLRRGMEMEIVPDTRLSILNERCVGGAIALSWENKFYNEWKKTITLPLVRINGASDHLNNCYSVCPNGIYSLQKLINQLWELKHRKIAFFFFNDYEHEIHNVARRLEGFLAAMQSHGMGDPEQYCFFDCLQKTSEELVQQLVTWHREGMTALIFAGAIGTGKMMQCIQLAGLRVPQDLSVIGWEQHDLSCYTIPPLHTLSPDPEEISRAAVTLLIQMIKRCPDVHDILLPYRWIERESIGIASIPSGNSVAR
ncbi:MAG: LacI family transcriptional regulator [Oligosphaeraceae bacterium]|nr:LacI family transcriptional regulator [Oligosphaeraceae bacterium]